MSGYLQLLPLFFPSHPTNAAYYLTDGEPRAVSEATGLLPVNDSPWLLGTSGSPATRSTPSRAIMKQRERKPRQTIDPGHASSPGGTTTPDRTTPASKLAHGDTQQTGGAYDLDEMFPGDLSTRITRDGQFPVAAGGSADIYKGTFHWQAHPTPMKVAIKAIKVYSAEDNHPKKIKIFWRLQREIRVWMKLNHVNVLSLFGTTLGFGPFPAMVCPWFENGTLTSYLERHGAYLEIQRILTLIHNVASGLQYLHSRSVVHGDLSGSNVLVDADGRACIADFGLSMVLEEIGESIFATSSIGKPRGTLRWAAPELLDLVDYGDEPARPTMQSDIYSFGGIMFQILSGRVPYHYYCRDMQIIGAIFRGETSTRPDDPRVTDSRWEFILRCWSPCKERPCSEEVVAFSTEDLFRES